MKLFLMCFLMLSTTYVLANTGNEEAANQELISDSKLKVDKFSDTQVTNALETADSTLDLIGRDIASEGEIEVVE